MAELLGHISEIFVLGNFGTNVSVLLISLSIYPLLMHAYVWDVLFQD